MAHQFLTLGDLRRALAEFPNTPEFNNLPLIYSTDDEGNEWQAVNNLPSVVRIKEMDARCIEQVDSSDSDDDSIGVDAFIIN